MKRAPVSSAVVFTLLVAAWSAAEEAPKAPPEKSVRGKVRTEITFSLAAEFPNAEGREYGLTRVQKGGAELPPPANMRLDPKTGAFAWTPTESQCGEYEIHFLVRNANGENARTLRLVAIETPPIVPPGDQSEIAKLLRQWAAEGTAAGNLGDFYDNRDRTHSLLNTQPYPQLDRIEYTKEQLDRRMDWALQLRFLYPHVTFGNSSTASGDPNLGSNPRHAFLNPGGAQVLHTHYVRSHLYIYPEHRDHDPGHNGRGGGYGDLFPVNTPYFIISQGSSGSDQPFMRAVPYTLAAFRPEVKALLLQRGLLMPTVQMILRRCGKFVNKPEDYLTSTAHPTVFEGSEVSALRMVQLAHEIQRDNVPPLAQIAAVEEDLALNGVDYFDDPRLGERFFETPVVIARIVRSTKHTRRMVVSAKGSFDANNRPLTFHWVVLRGDAGRIKINPVEKDGSVAELLVPYHERRPIAPGSQLESNRVDIGVFVHNGVYFSPPAFVCFYSLDDEARTYDDQGRIREMYYGYGDSSIGHPHGQLRARDKGYDVTDWPALFAILGNEKGGLASDLLRRQFKPDQLAALQQAAKDLDAALAANAEPQSRLDEADAAAKKARAAADDARKKADEARQAQEKEPTDAAKAALADVEAKLKALQVEQQRADDLARDLRRKLDDARQGEHKALVAEPPALGAPVKFRIEAALNAVKDDAALYPAHAKAIHALADACQDAAAKRAFLNARDELVKLGLLKPEGDGFSLSPALAGPKPPAERLTRFERSKLEWLNIAIMQGLLYPGALNRHHQRNFVCVFLATPKTWRDLYHYDDQGRLTGWTRTEGTEAREFTADGALVTKKDALGRALEARTVAYITEGGERTNRVLKQKPGDTIHHYEYADEKDRIGHIAKTEKAPP